MRNIIKKIHGVSLLASLSIETNNYTVMILNKEGNSARLCFSRNDFSPALFDELEALKEGDHHSLKSILNVLLQEAIAKFPDKKSSGAPDNKEQLSTNHQKMLVIIDASTKSFNELKEAWQQNKTLNFTLFEHSYSLKNNNLYINQKDNSEVSVTLILNEWDELAKLALLEYLFNEDIFSLGQLFLNKNAYNPAVPFLEHYETISNQWASGHFVGKKAWGNVLLTLSQGEHSRDAYLLINNTHTEQSSYVQSVHPLVSQLLFHAFYNLELTAVATLLQQSLFLTPGAADVAKMIMDEVLCLSAENEQNRLLVAGLGNNANQFFPLGQPTSQAVENPNVQKLSL